MGMNRIPDTLSQYNACKVRYEKRVDVYRSEPDERNRLSCSPCLTQVLMNNHDLRNYLVTEVGFPLSKIPLHVLREFKGLHLWKENENPHRAFFFFDILFGEATFDRQLTGKPGRIELLVENGYTALRNMGAREWEDYDRYEENQARYFRSKCREKRLQCLSVIK